MQLYIKKKNDDCFLDMNDWPIRNFSHALAAVKMLIILRGVSCSFDTRICGTAKNRLIRKGRGAAENMTGKSREREFSPGSSREIPPSRRKTHGINPLPWRVLVKKCPQREWRRWRRRRIGREAEVPRGGNWKPRLFSSDRPAEKNLLNRFIMQRSGQHAKTVAKPLALKSGNFPTSARKNRGMKGTPIRRRSRAQYTRRIYNFSITPRSLPRTRPIAVVL